MQVVQFGVMSNHLHLVVEHAGKRSLSRGMQGLGVRLAKAFNRAWRRKGKVFADRYHSRPLRTPLEARRGLAYALNNLRHHAAQRGRVLPRGWFDPYSSYASFDGWARRPLVPTATRIVTVRARTWLLREGWRRHGLIPVDEIPGAHTPRARRERPRANGRAPPRC
jgi:hypothetical protein